MSQDTEIINRVASSPLITVDLEDFFQEGDRIGFDIKDWLFQEMILKEKDFRNFVNAHDWSQYAGKHVAMMCSVDAIVPTWAYMLITTRLEPFAATVVYGSVEDLEKFLFKSALDQMEIADFVDKKVVIKGCGDLPVPEYAYVEVTRKLRPVVASLMYGEPCSTVPLYKRKK